MKLFRIRHLLALALCAALIGCGGATGENPGGDGGDGGGGGGGGGTTDPNALVPRADPLAVAGYELVETRQISADEVEYIYRAVVVNDGLGASGITARLSGAPAGVTIVEGELSFGGVGRGEGGTSSNTFTIRRDLNQPFNTDDLAWDLQPVRDSVLELLPELTSLRMSVGESRTLTNLVQVVNEAGGSISVNVDTIVDGNNVVEVTVDARTLLSAPAGFSESALIHTVNAIGAGRALLTLGVGIPGGDRFDVLIEVIVSSDLDGDGVGDAIDLCPNTAPGAEVDTTGCAQLQVEDTRDFTFIRIGEIVFKARASAITDVVENGVLTGIHVTGDLLVETPLADIVIYETDVIFQYAASGPPTIDRLVGSAAVPFPAMGILAGAEIAEPVRATLGLDFGRNLAALEAPLNDDRQYLFFDFSGGFAAQVGPVSFAAPFNQSVTFVLDVTDPFFFLTGNIPGLEQIGRLRDLGIGVSVQGLIPFVPTTTFGVEADVGEFQGHLYLKGKIPFARIPLELDGEVVANFDPDGDGGTPFNDPIPDINFGGNGQLNVSVGFLQFFEFGFPLGTASVVVKGDSVDQLAYFSGVLEPDTSFLPQELVPIRPQRSVRIAGLMSSQLQDSFFAGESEYGIDASGLSDLVGVDLNDLPQILGTMRVDRAGILLRGTSSGSIHPALQFNNDTTIEARFTGNPLDWGISFASDLNIAGVGLDGAFVEVSTAGLFAGGAFVTPLSEINMDGAIDRNGVNVTGRAEVTIPISGLEEGLELITNGAICGFDFVTDFALCGGEIVTSGAICGFDFVTSGALCGFDLVTDVAVCGVETLTSAAICGTELVTDAAVCGFDFVTDGAVCGFETLTSAAICGTEVVTDAAVCGFDFVTNGAVCGFNTVTSAAACGVSTVTSAAICGTETVVNSVVCAGSAVAYAACLVNPFDSNCERYITCNVAKSCEVANTCQIEASCNVPASCSIASTCQVESSCAVPGSCSIASTCQVAGTCEIEASCNIPNSCQDPAQPRTCEDLTQPRTCERVVDIDLPVGDFVGIIDLAIGNLGVGGSVSGQYCDGGCTTIAAGRVSFGADPEACVQIADVPGVGLGEFCVSF